MSNHLISSVYKRQLGTHMRKSVMALLADKASDDGSGIWASKQTLADELCCSKQTVIATIARFIEDGLLKESGRRKCRTGATVEYTICVGALEALPMVPCHAAKESSRLTGQAAQPVNLAEARGQAAGPKPSRNHPPKKDKPSLVARAGRKHPLPDGWKPEPFSDDAQCAEIIALWQPGRIERELSKFRANHIAKGSLFKNWQAAWKTWVINSLDFERGGNGQRQPGIGLRGTRPDPALDLYRQGLAEEAAERSAQAPDRGARASLPALGAG